MFIVRARGHDPETCRELFILAAEILGVAAVSVGVSRLKPAAPTVERATVRTDTVKRDPMLRQMRGSRQIPAETEATVVRIHMQYQGPSSEAVKRSDETRKPVPLLCAHDAQAQRQADTRLKNTFSL